MMNNQKPMEAFQKVGDEVGKLGEKAKDTLIASKDKVAEALDANNDGKIDVQDIIIIALKTPGVNINRADFLEKQFMKNYPQEVIQDAIKFNPAHAGITVEEIDKIADQVIQYERNCVSGISLALGCRVVLQWLQPCQLTLLNFTDIC